MSNRQFSHYVISVSGEKGLEPWLAEDDEGGFSIVNDLTSAEPFESKAEARDPLGWARVEYGPGAKTMAVHFRTKVSPKVESDTYDVWVTHIPSARADEYASRDSEAAIEFATRFDLADNTAIGVTVRKSGERETSSWRVELNEAGWLATRCDGGVGLEYRRVKP